MVFSVFLQAPAESLTTPSRGFSTNVRDCQHCYISLKCVTPFTFIMAALLANKCGSPLTLLNRLICVPQWRLRCGYHEKVVDHYENPRNVGSLDKNAKNVGTGLVGAPACGDVMKLQIEVDDHGKIVNAKFKTFGCGSAIASSSLATEWVKGKSVDEALTIKNTEIAKELSLPPVKLHCSMLAEDAIKAALADYRLKQEGEEGKKKVAASD